MQTGLMFWPAISWRVPAPGSDDPFCEYLGQLWRTLFYCPLNQLALWTVRWLRRLKRPLVICVWRIHFRWAGESLHWSQIWRTLLQAWYFVLEGARRYYPWQRAPLWGICKFLLGLLKRHQGKDQGQRRQLPPLPPLNIRPAVDLYWISLKPVFNIDLMYMY